MAWEKRKVQSRKIFTGYPPQAGKQHTFFSFTAILSVNEHHSIARCAANRAGGVVR